MTTPEIASKGRVPFLRDVSLCPDPERLNLVWIREHDHRRVPLLSEPWQRRPQVPILAPDGAPGDPALLSPGIPRQADLEREGKHEGHRRTTMASGHCQ